jgi:quinohemoprotein ethanol dehydrogenase
MQAPKNGFFYVLDRTTGEFMSGDPYVPVSWASGIDAKTERPIETTEARYGTKGSWVSPGPGGAHTWEPMSWNPNTGLVYFPARRTMAFFRTAPSFEPISIRDATYRRLARSYETP